MAAIARIVPELQTEGREFELHPGMHGFLETEVGLSDDQIEAVIELSRQLAVGS